MTRTVWIGYSVNDFESTRDSSSGQRRRFIWSDEMEKLFVNSILKLGVNATPSLILKEMNVPSLTRNQVSSHLQKYRFKVRQGGNTSRQSKLSVDYLIN